MTLSPKGCGWCYLCRNSVTLSSCSPAAFSKILAPSSCTFAIDLESQQQQVPVTVSSVQIQAQQNNVDDDVDMAQDVADTELNTTESDGNSIITVLSSPRPSSDDGDFKRLHDFHGIWRSDDAVQDHDHHKDGHSDADKKKTATPEVATTTVTGEPSGRLGGDDGHGDRGNDDGNRGNGDEDSDESGSNFYYDYMPDSDFEDYQLTPASV